MNSLNKHVPMLVFLLGLGFVLLAARTFFHPKPIVLPAVVSQPIPTSPPQQVGVSDRTGSVTHNDTTAVTVPTRYRGVEASAPKVDDKPTLQIRDRHLKAIGLKITLPEGWKYRETQDGPIKILSARTAEGQDGFYMFSGKGAYTAEQARDYVMGYMSDGTKLNPPGAGQKVDSSSGMADMTLFKGTSPEGYSYQMIYFKDPVGQSHMVMLMDSEDGFKKNTKLIQDTLNSIRVDR